VRAGGGGADSVGGADSSGGGGGGADSGGGVVYAKMSEYQLNYVEVSCEFFEKTRKSFCADLQMLYFFFIKYECNAV